MPSPPLEEPLTSRPGVDRFFLRASREIQPLAALTPLEACRERERLTAELAAGGRVIPRWTYARVANDGLRRALDAVERELSASKEPLSRLYLARAQEMSLDAALCAAAGTPDIARLARQRFAPLDPSVARAASDLCGRWIGEACQSTGDDPSLGSDDPDPRSLLSRMRAAIGNLRLPFAVVTQRSLAPLAATGERVIVVAAGRRVSESDAIRTVLHEVEGHARPRARSLDAPIGLFRAGTARGTDDQEGRALLLEERAGLLTQRRRRQLAARHRAVEAMHDGGSFADVASMLIRVHGFDAAEAVIAAERVFRGGDGERPGLGRERVYLEALIRVGDHLREHPDDEQVLAAGQVAVEAVPVLRPWALSA